MRPALNQMDLFMPPPAAMPEADQHEIIVPYQDLPRGPFPMEPAEISRVRPCPQPGDCEWVAFMRTNGRTPRLGDIKAPWEYKGWLMYYRTMCEGHPDVPARWDYWARTVEAGRLLDEAIPKLTFAGHCAERDPEYKMIDKWVDLIYRKTWNYGAMGELMNWFLWGFGDRDVTAPPKFPDDVNEALYRQVDIGPLLLKPADWFGSWISYHKGPHNPHAFFPTPMHVVQCMNQMTFHDIKGDGDPRLQTVCDPCIGTGRFLMDAGSYSLCLSGIDIDPVNLAVSKVNAYLYVPWMVRPFPEMVTGYKPGRFGLFRGDSLAQELTDYGLLSVEDSRKYRELHWPQPPAPEPKIRSKKARAVKAQALLEAECSSTVM